MSHIYSNQPRFATLPHLCKATRTAQPTIHIQTYRHIQAMSNGSNPDHYYRIHTKSNDPDVERYLLENERLRTFEYTLGYPFPNP